MNDFSDWIDVDHQCAKNDSDGVESVENSPASMNEHPFPQQNSVDRPDPEEAELTPLLLEKSSTMIPEGPPNRPYGVHSSQ